MCLVSSWSNHHSVVPPLGTKPSTCEPLRDTQIQHTIYWKLFLSLWMVLTSFSKISDHICESLFLGFLLFYSIESIFSVHMLLPYYFNYCNFVVSFKVRKSESANFIFFKFIYCFEYSGSFVMWIWIWESDFSFLTKGCWCFDRDCIESVDCFGSIDTLKMLSFPIYEPGLPFHLHRYSLISFSNVL
jgi:hypothetical protein